MIAANAMTTIDAGRRHAARSRLRITAAERARDMVRVNRDTPSEALRGLNRDPPSS
ncbi:hypothetical protein GCM10009800_32840 [Nocardiopsis rhodophaea]